MVDNVEPHIINYSEITLIILIKMWLYRSEKKMNDLFLFLLIKTYRVKVVTSV